MSEVVSFPFENPLVGQIESVDLTMCETIVSLQRNQTFFHKMEQFEILIQNTDI